MPEHDLDLPDLFPRSNRDDIPDEMWKRPTPIERQVAAGELWKKLTAEPEEDEEKTGSRLRKAVEIVERPDAVLKHMGLEHKNFKMMLGGKDIGSLSAVPDAAGGWRVKGSHIDPKFHGLGLGKKLYGEATRRLPKGGLKSDPGMVSDAAQRVWRSAARRRPSLTHVPEVFGTAREAGQAVMRLPAAASIGKSADATPHLAPLLSEGGPSAGQVVMSAGSILKDPKARAHAKQLFQKFVVSGKEKYPELHRLVAGAGNPLELGKFKQVRMVGKVLGDSKLKGQALSAGREMLKLQSAPRMLAGAAAGAAGAGSMGAYLQYLRSIERPGGKSREELSREENLNQLHQTAENENREGRMHGSRLDYAKNQLDQAKENKQNPGRAAALAALPWAAVGGALGAAGGYMAD